jgi:hypothetical protein
MSEGNWPKVFIRNDNRWGDEAVAFFGYVDGALEFVAANDDDLQCPDGMDPVEHLSQIGTTPSRISKNKSWDLIWAPTILMNQMQLAGHSKVEELFAKGEGLSEEFEGLDIADDLKSNTDYFRGMLMSWVQVEKVEKDEHCINCPLSLCAPELFDDKVFMLDTCKIWSPSYATLLISDTLRADKEFILSILNLKTSHSVSIEGVLENIDENLQTDPDILKLTMIEEENEDEPKLKKKRTKTGDEQEVKDEVETVVEEEEDEEKLGPEELVLKCSIYKIFDEELSPLPQPIVNYFTSDLAYDADRYKDRCEMGSLYDDLTCEFHADPDYSDEKIRKLVKEHVAFHMEAAEAAAEQQRLAKEARRLACLMAATGRLEAVIGNSKMSKRKKYQLMSQSSDSSMVSPGMWN